jgi:hypothetical protein
MKKLLTAAALATTVFAAGAAGAATNIVVNGDFSAGNVGFTSGYTFAPYLTDMHAEGLYTVGSNPFAVHTSWIDLEDGNNRLIVNGATSEPLPFVWREDVAAAAGTYDFSLDAANICCNTSYSGPNLPSLLTFQYSNDGGATFNNLGVILTTPPGDAGIFHSISGSFVLPTAATLRLQIGSGTDFAGGNDFAIDNIVVSAAVPEPTSWALMIGGFGLAGAALRRRRMIAVAA